MKKKPTLKQQPQMLMGKKQDPGKGQMELRR
jgi:hypothetical protein